MTNIEKNEVYELYSKGYEFSVDLWNLMIQEAPVQQDKTITFKFKNGKEVTI